MLVVLSTSSYAVRRDRNEKTCLAMVGHPCRVQLAVVSVHMPVSHWNPPTEVIQPSFISWHSVGRSLSSCSVVPSFDDRLEDNRGVPLQVNRRSIGPRA